MTDRFVNLHNHSDYSILDGFGTLDEYIARAKELDQTALGLTDHGNLYGVHEFIERCHKAGIKPIPGIEAYMAPQNPLGARCHKPVRYGKPGQESIDVSGAGAYLHLTLFAINYKGLENLYKLTEEASKEGNPINHLPLKEGEGNFYQKPRMDIDMLAAHSEGLVATTGCPSGEIQTRFRLGQDQEAYDYARRMSEMFPGRYYVEVMNHDMHGDIERVCMDRLLKLASDLSLPLLATNDSHYCRSEDSYHHSEMLCSNSNAYMTDPTYDQGGRRFAFDASQYYLKSRAEMKRMLRDDVFEEALDNTMRLADSVEDIDFKKHGDLRPRIEIPDGYTEKEWFRKVIEDGYKAKRVDAGCDEKTLAESRKRIEHEFPVYVDNDFAQYMLVVQDYISWARNNGIPVGFGRGSVGGSEIAYVMGISDTDPIRHDLMFERFLNPERVSPPDVDTDFAASRRDDVLDYVKERYGQDHIANIVTFSKFLSKTALKDMARIYHIPVFESEKAVALIPSEPHKKNIPTTLAKIYDPDSDVYEAGADFRKLMEEPQWRKVIEAARAVEGRTKTTGVHACGTIMCSRPISDVAPMVYKHNPTKPWGSSYCQWTYQELESMGLIKMDFLSLSDLDIVADTLRNIRHTHDGKAPDMHALVHGPMDDKATYEMLAKGDTIGVFQTSSEGMQSLFRSMHPTSFDDIMASVALYRPGPMDMDAHVKYALRKSGREQPFVVDQDMDGKFKGTPVEDVLKPTLGLCVYQEQVMRISMELSGFSWRGADELRKGMGHKIMAVLNEMEPKFIEGAEERNKGIPDSYVRKLWDFLKAFGEYGFNKSHSASYGIITYETAWLKCHYPAEFMAAVMTDKFRNPKSPEEKIKIIKEVREMGLKVASVDVNNSGLFMTAFRKKKDSDPDIVFGFSGIKGVSEKAASDIITARESHDGDEFASIDDFMRSVHLGVVSKKSLDGIAGAGGFDLFGVSRRAMVAVNEDIYAYYKNENKARSAGKRSLFDMIDDDEDGDGYSESFAIPDIPEWDWVTLLEQEEKRLGVVITGHPLSNIGPGLKFIRAGFLYKPDGYGMLMSMEKAREIPITRITLSSGRDWYKPVPVRIIASIGSCEERVSKTGTHFLSGSLESVDDSMPFRVDSENLDDIMANMPMRNHVYVVAGEMTVDWNGNRMIRMRFADEVELLSDGGVPAWFRMTVHDTELKGYGQFIDMLRSHADPNGIPAMISVINPSDRSVSEIDTGVIIGDYDKVITEMEKMGGTRRVGMWTKRGFPERR